MESVKEILMRRNKITSEEADYLIEEFKEAHRECIDQGSLDEAYDLIGDYFGLEPEFLDDSLSEAGL